MNDELQHLIDQINELDDEDYVEVTSNTNRTIEIEYELRTDNEK